MVEITGNESNMVLLEKLIDSKMSRLSDEELFDELVSVVSEFKPFTEQDINDFLRTIEQSRVNGLYAGALINVYFKRNPSINSIDINYSSVSGLLNYLASGLPPNKKLNIIDDF